jgi:hypothetical protein
LHPQQHTHNGSFGWITIKSNNKIKYLKVPTYESLHHPAIIRSVDQGE